MIVIRSLGCIERRISVFQVCSRCAGVGSTFTDPGHIWEKQWGGRTAFRSPCALVDPVSHWLVYQNSLPRNTDKPPHKKISAGRTRKTIDELPFYRLLLSTHFAMGKRSRIEAEASDSKQPSKSKVSILADEGAVDPSLALLFSTSVRLSNQN